MIFQKASDKQILDIQNGVVFDFFSYLQKIEIPYLVRSILKKVRHMIRTF